jgi:hypothetical protein
MRKSGSDRERDNDVELQYKIGVGKRILATVNGVKTAYIGNYFEWDVTGQSFTKYYFAGSTRVAMRHLGAPPKWLLGDHLGSTSVVYYMRCQPITKCTKPGINKMIIDLKTLIFSILLLSIGINLLIHGWRMFTQRKVYPMPTEKIGYFILGIMRGEEAAIKREKELALLFPLRYRIEMAFLTGTLAVFAGICGIISILISMR